MILDKKVTAVIVAAGSSSRMGFDKLLYPYRGKPVIYHTAAAFQEHPLVDRIILVTGKNDRQIRAALSGMSKVEQFVTGGADRVASVTAGVNAILEKQGLVAIQDGARPFVSAAVITRAIEQAAKTGAAAPAVAVKDTIKQAQDGKVVGTPPRSSLFAVQTPQVFDLEKYRAALAALPQNAQVTDDCSVFEQFGGQVVLTQGEYSNIKLTTKEDLALMGREDADMRIGHGYDVHRLTEGRKLILGGQHIPYEKGLLGHSDADVLTHAVMDALLGAAALGDIGQHFPDTAPDYAGADSIKLLSQVGMLLLKDGWQPVNIDATILCQAPRLAGYIPAMRRAIAHALRLEEGQVSVKATTEEHLGFTGAGEGIAAHAVCLIQPVAGYVGV
ncbi:MAG: 2-C-methyl-D-erythritol 2,4-cyclodiphosphate synthase [Pygmaiobacter massiliensis]|nr:2-C-methyl-D-erythritol 2,4-cyclodiphosphate synthase [Pygmaiobacter massiliensis]